MRNCVTPKAEDLTAPQIRPFCLAIEPTDPLADAATPMSALAELLKPTATWAARELQVCRDLLDAVVLYSQASGRLAVLKGVGGPLVSEASHSKVST
jgi:hypothetical protein